jgi:hypothetical protein
MFDPWGATMVLGWIVGVYCAVMFALFALGEWSDRE